MSSSVRVGSSGHGGAARQDREVVGDGLGLELAGTRQCERAVADTPRPEAVCVEPIEEIAGQKVRGGQRESVAFDHDGRARVTSEDVTHSVQDRELLALDIDLHDVDACDPGARRGSPQLGAPRLQRPRDRR